MNNVGGKAIGVAQCAPTQSQQASLLGEGDDQYNVMFALLANATM